MYRKKYLSIKWFLTHFVIIHCSCFVVHGSWIMANKRVLPWSWSWPSGPGLGGAGCSEPHATAEHRQSSLVSWHTMGAFFRFIFCSSIIWWTVLWHPAAECHSASFLMPLSVVQCGRSVSFRVFSLPITVSPKGWADAVVGIVFGCGGGIPLIE